MNVKSAKNLEFIQITRSVEFTLDMSSPAFLSGEVFSTPVENIRQIHLKNKKQTQSQVFEIELSSSLTSK